MPSPARPRRWRSRLGVLLEDLQDDPKSKIIEKQCAFQYCYSKVTVSIETSSKNTRPQQVEFTPRASSALPDDSDEVDDDNDDDDDDDGGDGFDDDDDDDFA